MITLVALFAISTGAWAEEKMVTINSSTTSSGAVTATGFGEFENYLYVSKNPATITTSEGVITKLVIKKGNLYGGGFTEANVGVTPGTITYGSDVITVTDINAESVTLSRKGNDNWSTSSVDVYYGAPTTFPFPITWDAANKTTGFNLPAGNVFMNVEYYPQAAFATGGAPTAINDVPATTDGAIVKEGTVANIPNIAELLAQGQVMYYVSQTAKTDAELLALAADAWTADVPTAEKLAEGTAYVYYYIKGNDSQLDDEIFSDGDIKAANGFEVTLAAAPTYKVEFAEGTPETDKWKADPNPAKKGQTVTATYSGSRKVKSVKAVKKVNPNAYLKWDANQNKLVETDIPAEVTTVQNADENIEWAAGTYVVEGEVTINGKIWLTGNVDLIIKDGAKLTATRISSPYNDKKNLSIYGQSKMNGELVINTTSLYAMDYLTTLEVHSCKVTAYSTSNGGIIAVNTINVYGGLLDAKYTGSDGYGIYLSGGGEMNIYGGEVKAASNGTGANSYGIMASSYDSAITVTVYGGKLWAESPGNTVFNTNKTTLAKGAGFTGKIETSSDGSSWTEYTQASTPDAKYVRVGY